MHRWRIEFDYSATGAIIGFVLAVAEFVGLIWLSIRIERQVDTPTATTTACLLRLVALLGLAFGTGIGYLIGRSIGGS